MATRGTPERPLGRCRGLAGGVGVAGDRARWGVVAGSTSCCGVVRRTYAGEVLPGEEEGRRRWCAVPGRDAGRVRSGACEAVQSDPIGVSDVQMGSPVRAVFPPTCGLHEHDAEKSVGHSTRLCVLPNARRISTI